MCEFSGSGTDLVNQNLRGGFQLWVLTGPRVIRRQAKSAEPLPGLGTGNPEKTQSRGGSLSQPSLGRPSPPAGSLARSAAAGVSGWGAEATRTLPDVDLAAEPVVQHKAVVGYQHLEGKGAGVGHLGQAHLSSGIRDLGEDGQCRVTSTPLWLHPPPQAKQQTRGGGNTTGKSWATPSPTSGSITASQSPRIHGN